MQFFIVVLAILSTLIASYITYYLVISLAIVRPFDTLPATDKHHRLAVVIAARNEESVIGGLLDSLKKQDYPADRFDVFVIPNNCSDDTEGVSRRYGAKIVRVPTTVRSKGAALHHFFEEHYRQNDYDGYVVFDADNLVSADFLTIANRAISAGYSAMMGHRDSKNPTDSAISASYTIFYYALNRLYNRPRTLRGMNAMISGTGFMLTKEHLRALGGWHTQTLIEDAEMTALSSLQGLSIRYEPTARFYDEQPRTFMSSWHQRMRWSVGSQQNMRLYGLECLRQALSDRGKDAFDHFLMFSATYLQLIGVLAMGLSLLIGLYHPSPRPSDIGLLISLSLGAMVLFPTALAIVVLWLEGRSLLRMWRGIGYFWFFMLTWTPINLLALFQKTVDWKPIRHDATSSIEEMLE
ncbi:MAG TPA: glycosyltransferase family 2 protein [Tissierellia bacterium]|nr:glycosyltransferase family 2 protein [Tissierellia bacterium]